MENIKEEDCDLLCEIIFKELNTTVHALLKIIAIYDEETSKPFLEI